MNTKLSKRIAVAVMTIMAGAQSIDAQAQGGTASIHYNSPPAASMAAAIPKIYGPNTILQGHSLSDLAEISGYFNTCVIFGPWMQPPIDFNTCQQSYPYTPFQIIGGKSNYIVRKGAVVYLPVYVLDPYPPMPGKYPLMDTQCDQNEPSCYNGPIGSPSSVRTYFFDKSGYGFYDIGIYVDGAYNKLSQGHVIGVNSPLIDGTQAYIVAGAFVKPMTPGTHTLGFRGYVDGAAGKWNFDVPSLYTVTVK